jgi:hypothetical protein
MKLELEAPEATLVLDTNERGWCQVVLRLPDRVLALGAEMHKTVIARLINGVSDRLPGPISGRIDGVPVPWVVSLFEQHSSVYAADVDEGRRLFIQDRDAKWIAVMTLSAEDRRRWLSRLGAEHGTT